LVPFTMVPNQSLEDTGLSWKAKGILIYLLGKPPNWKVRVNDIVNHARDGEEAVRSGLMELRMNGYVKLEKIGNGRGSEWNHKVCSVPYFDKEQSTSKKLKNKTLTKDRHGDNPDVDNPDCSKKGCVGEKKGKKEEEERCGAAAPTASRSSSSNASHKGSASPPKEKRASPSGRSGPLSLQDKEIDALGDYVDLDDKNIPVPIEARKIHRLCESVQEILSVSRVE